MQNILTDLLFSFYLKNYQTSNNSIHIAAAKDLKKRK